jgi:hypothetical protein
MILKIWYKIQNFYFVSTSYGLLQKQSYQSFSSL